MKVSVPLGELTHKMNAISSVVPGKTTMPILSTVLMNAEKGVFSISATDLDISVTSRVDATVAEDGRVAAPAKKIAEIVKSLAGETVGLECAGGEDNDLVRKEQVRDQRAERGGFPEAPETGKQNVVPDRSRDHRRAHP